ncbi:MAG: hypothetical protein DHS80DRAFT_28550 [Piptocephalis tieghemiana]|nr:MAG: hypothetical protein DHS80DRAFT_28550 [Piptocephalis tieghemiana]
MSLRSLLQPLRLSAALTRRSFGTSLMSEAEKTIYCANVPFLATHEEVRDVFTPHGEVLDVHLPLNAEGRSRGLAFVRMEEGDAQAFLDKEITLELGGRQLKTAPAKERAPRSFSRE